MESSNSPEYNGYQSMGVIYKNEDPYEDLWPPYCNPSYTMPERIEVKVPHTSIIC